MGAPVTRTAAAVDLLGSHAAAFRRTARRVSLCTDDADDALQRASLILLEKAPPHPPARLAAWMHLVTKHEALAIRRERERLLGCEVSDHRASGALCPSERAERREWAHARAKALRRLKPDERRALVLLGEGYSYREISELNGWSYTKVNRCLCEGRARLRELGALEV